jgi:proteasome lid subunit RPN8/RPN11
VADQPLRFARGLWTQVLHELRVRGEDRHEAGAFLLGPVDSKHRLVTQAIYYDELDANAYSTGVCVLYADTFEVLWRLCRQRKLRAVADIHTHPGPAGQSPADRENPMVARDGHIAIIVPNFARPPVWRHRLGLYRYLGAHRWTDRSGWRARHWLHTGTLR